MKYKIIIPIEEPKEVLCGEANKFYRCITCDAPCGSEGHYIEVTEEQSNNDMNKILWISNNPQCKLIESCYNSLSKKCICPKEEPKQDLEKEMFELEQELDIPSSMRWHNSKPKQEIKLEDIFNDEKKQGVKDLIDAHKQETTLEEVAKWSLEKAKEFALERFKSDRKKAIVTWDSILEVLKVGVKTGHKFGTKHQAERMYSEEDMRGMYDKSCGLIGLSLLNDQTENDSRFKKLLEQFKKK
jgi:DNA polymerase IIIc chi subunit